jgi:hypothetical protein
LSPLPLFPFLFFFLYFRASVPHGEAVEIFLLAGSWLTRPFVARKAVATGLLEWLWRLKGTAVEDLAGDSPAVGVLGMPPPRADPLRNLRLRHPPRRHPLPPPRQPPLKPSQVPPRQPPVAPKQLEPQERGRTGAAAAILGDLKGKRPTDSRCLTLKMRGESRRDKSRCCPSAISRWSYSPLASRTP